MSINIGTQTIGGASGSVVAASITDASATGVSVLTGTAAQGRTALSVPPASRIVGGLDLSADRSAADLMTSLGASSYASGLEKDLPAASAGLVGQIYYATDTGTPFQCVSSTVWRRVGSQGVEGLATTSVQLGSGIGARAVGNVSISAGSILSCALIFAEGATPSGVGVISIFESVQVEIGNNSGDRHKLSVWRNGFGASRQEIGSISTNPTNRHAVAMTFSGITTRWSIDGSAVATVSHVSGSASGATELTFGSPGFPSNVYLSSIVLWTSTVGDSDLAIVSASAVAAAGVIPTVAGATEAVRWHARQYPFGVLNQQISVAGTNGALTWSNGFPLFSRAN